jgi:hypothetical protein
VNKPTDSDVLGKKVGALSLARIESTGEGELSVNAIDTVHGIEVLNAGDLEAGGGTLARSDRGVGKEVLPDTEPAGAVLGVDLVLVAQPVAVPPPESGGVVNTDSISHLDLEAGTLEGVDDEAEGSRSVSTGEDVFVHEQTPGEVLELPCLAETGDLQEEDTVVLEHVVDLAEEGTQVTDTDVLGHLEAGDLVVAAGGDGDLAVVHAEDLGLVLLDANALEAVVAPGGLVATECDTSNVCTVICRSELGECTPTAADVEHPLALLQADLLANNGHLVVLELLERLLLVDVGDDTRGVDHAWAEEPAVEVVTAVVVVADLLLV